MIPFFLCVWAVIAIFLTLGLHSQFAATSNYIFWLIFVNFTPMQSDFDGGFDLFMIGAGFFLLFLPLDRSFSIDSLRKKLSSQFFSSIKPLPTTTTILAYQIPVMICLGFLYFDSAINKLFAEHWRNGLGAWLPSIMPYYISAIDMSWLLNIEWFQKFIGYLILAFQFTFIFLFNKRYFRALYILIGVGLHLGITLSFNIYPFGIGMLIFYFFLIPFSFWKSLKQKITFSTPLLTVFYDEQCPLCNRTVITINHFDICKAIKFKGLQTHARTTPAFDNISENALLADLYALDKNSKLFSGLDTYIQILYKMRYPSVFGWMLNLPIIYHIASFIYRKIADNRLRQSCDKHCIAQKPTMINYPSWYMNIFDTYAQTHPKKFSRQLAKIILLTCILQLNSTIHYGILYRLDFDFSQNKATQLLHSASNAILMLSQTFLGITPHALYMNDHFEGYNKILAITYIEKNGVETWLPFINEQGRILAPNWGRVHSMWANIAVTPKINETRLEKFVMKVTAFWGTKLGLDLNNTEFIIKQKNITVPNYWQYDLRKNNLLGNWQNIGTAKWINNRITCHINYNFN
jgi:predicted DCC family thiol-disulfide oxidoreductase YuxK